MKNSHDEMNNQGATTMTSYSNLQMSWELDFLWSVTIRIDRRLETVYNEITYLREKSKQDNILIHNLQTAAVAQWAREFASRAEGC